MKKLLLLCLVLMGFGGYSQITLDFQIPNYFLQNIKLNNSESKYFENILEKINSLNQFNLYNLDGSLYKTIQLPPKPDVNAQIWDLNFITTTLFDNDPSNIEFLVTYFCDSLLSGASDRVKIIREDGTILLDEAGATTFYGDIHYIVSNTEEGAKLILYYYQNGHPFPFNTKVYNLPGELPTAMEEKTNPGNNNLSLYPNPNNGSFYIKLNGKAGETNTLDLYSVNGKLIDTFKSDNSTIHVNKYGLPDGMYYLNSRVSVLRSTTTTKMVISK